MCSCICPSICYFIRPSMSSSIFCSICHSIHPGKCNPGFKWLKNNLKEFGLPFSSRQMILAGTTLGLYPVKSGDTIDVYINEQLAVTCNIEI